jgi:hypothetical protein
VATTPGAVRNEVVTDQPGNEQPVVAKRGEAAWKEAKDRVAERNEQARKAGKLRRDAKNRLRVQELRAAERREMAEALSQHDGR